mgnify:CR=1 FL=1|jgi:hypothetical protein
MQHLFSDAQKLVLHGLVDAWRRDDDYIKHTLYGHPAVNDVLIRLERFVIDHNGGGGHDIHWMSVTWAGLVVDDINRHYELTSYPKRATFINELSIIVNEP